MMLFKKRKVNEYKVGTIIQKEFLDDFKASRKIIIYVRVTKRGVVELHSNVPGVLIGKHGTTINRLKDVIIREANAKDVKVYDMNTFCSNIKDFY